MVVQETASSAGGSAKASAQTGSPEGPGPTTGSMTATLSGVRFAVVVSLLRAIQIQHVRLDDSEIPKQLGQVFYYHI